MKEPIYRTGWGGKPDTVDGFSAKILMVLKYAGDTISYKDACFQIDELVKWREENEI